MDKKTLTNFAFNRIMIGILVCILVLSSLYIPIESNIDNPGTSGDNKDNSGSSIYSQNDVTVDYTSEIVIDLEFPKSSISNQNFEGYDILTIPGGEVLYNSGFPSLPYKPITLVLPWDLNIEDIEIKTTAIEQITLEGNYNILPAQEPRPLYEYDPEVESSELIETFEQDQEAYDSGSQYPGIIIERVTETDYHAIKLGQFSVFPIQYIPSAQKINLYTKLTN